jgi:hypothetical protein
MMRGLLEETEAIIKELSSQYLKTIVYDAHKKALDTRFMQLRVCPITLWDISYQKQHRDVIHNTLFHADKGKPINARLNPMIFGLRKMMGLQPVQPWGIKHQLPMRLPQHSEMIAIGVKDDYWITPDGKHWTEKEAKTKNNAREAY